MDNKVALVVGLGNPGPDYRFTRHNAGALFLESLCDAYQGELRSQGKFFGLSAQIIIQEAEVRLLFPATYVNNSGRAVAAMANYYRIPPARVLIAYDELDLPAGIARLKSGGGSGGHKGIRDIVAALGDKDFHRLRIGIGHPGAADQVVKYVLSEPSQEDAMAIQNAIDKALALMPLLVEGKFQAAMNRLHTSPSRPVTADAERDGIAGA